MRRTARPVYFVGAAVATNGSLLLKTLPANCPQEAMESFQQEFGLPPQEILGPFYKKRRQIIETTRTLKFSNQIKKAIYNGWVVNAFLLTEPLNQAYLVFVKRQDGQKIAFPQGTITVPISDLRFLEDAE